MVWLLLLLIGLGLGAQRIRRPKPSPVAARVGEALPWLNSLQAALQAARERKKPVFWYVPTVPGSPMDRKPVLDFYMRAGFFSDPDLVPFLKAHFVCLRRVPDRAEARRFRLKPYDFVEPGFLVLDEQGHVLCREHSLTTYHAGWLYRRLATKERTLPADLPLAALRRARLEGREPPWAAVANGEGGELLKIERALAALGAGKPAAAERWLRGAATPRGRFLQGVSAWLQNRHGEARRIWRALARDHPDHFLGWRAAAEAEGFGPFARGFWIYRSLPPPRPGAGPGTCQPRPAADLPLLRRRGVAFLLTRQNERGGWEDSNYDFGGRESLPNVYVAVTAIAGWALVVHREVDPKACDRAIAKALAYVLDEKNLNPQDRNEWIWARVFPAFFLVALLDAPAPPPALGPEKLRRALAGLVKEMLRRQGGDGSFRHEYPNPFVTALVLLALEEARRHGVPVPAAARRRAVRALQAARTAEGAFTYAQPRRGSPPYATVPRSACRMPLCEAALFRAGAGDRERLLLAVRLSFRYHADLERIRKYDDHTYPLGLGGFFYWYDLLGREFAFRLLGAEGESWRAKQQALILQVPEIDGCFVDSHEVGRVYGTAMALLCLGS